MQLRCGCLSFFAFFSDLSFFAAALLSLFSGLAPLRFADPFGTFGGSSFKPKQRSCLGAFCFLKKTF